MRRRLGLGSPFASVTPIKVAPIEETAFAAVDAQVCDARAEAGAGPVEWSQAEVFYLHQRFPGRFAADGFGQAPESWSTYRDGDENADDEALVLAALGRGVTTEQVRRAIIRLFEAKKKRDLVIVTTFLDLWATQGPNPSDADVAEATGLPDLSSDEVRYALVWFNNRLGQLT